MSANVTIPDTTGPTYAQIFDPVFWALMYIRFALSTILAASDGYLYFTRFNDKLGIRLLVGPVSFNDITVDELLCYPPTRTFDILSTALVCQSVYYYMLPHFGNFTPLNAVTKYFIFPSLLSPSSHYLLLRRELTVECLIAAVITFTSQMYFVYQLHMAKTPGITAKVMIALVVVLGTVGLVREAIFHKSGCVGIMFMFPENIFMHRNHAFAVRSSLTLSRMLIQRLFLLPPDFRWNRERLRSRRRADIIATIAMCMFLRTSSMLQSLMHLIINRAILVTAAQALLLITFFATSEHLYWLAVHISTTKLYVNTFCQALPLFLIPRSRTATRWGSSTNESTIINQRSLMLGTKNAAATQKGELNDTEYALDIQITTSSAVTEI
ncbi:hypothetical protein GGX14DRAFT_662796 [Mycena pura]|uniref:DUF6534 domain-containing protein n=1 Tax=Mycena pura TaxID=153505 RepID=A0AAD6VTA9_9AGAR|nr:hypothetical protein GGX14DRAFT_662796 [Mycena pura]